MSPELSSIFQLFWFCGAGLSIIFILGLGLILAYLALEPFLSPGKSTPPPRHPWARLAEQHQLAFEHESGFLGSGRGPRLSGTYRGHQLTMEIIKKNYPETLLTVQAGPDTVLPSPTTFPTSSTLTPAQVVRMIAPAGLPNLWQGTISVDVGRRVATYQKGGEEWDVNYLQAALDFTCDVLERCPEVVALGGQAVPALVALAGQRDLLQRVAVDCLYHISQETEERLGRQAAKMICPDCLTGCASFPISVSHRQRSNYPNWKQPTYFGCRQCGQSVQFLETAGRQIVAILDAAETERIRKQAGQWRVNWFTHTRPFDFDEVEIIRVDDEAVERFAIQLGNDTDPVRRSRYRGMTCRVANGCVLSENTWRILRNTFGRVERSAELKSPR